MSWTLVIYIYAGVFAKGDSVAITHITNFKTEASCTAAGKAIMPLENMGRGKTTQEWFDILVQDIEEKL